MPDGPSPGTRRPLVVVMGVSGSGKSTVGRRLAMELGVPFVDGDDEHTPEAKARMAKGIPLDDAWRAPWLDRLDAILREHVEGGLVLACSALTRAYRRRLARGVPRVSFVALVAPARCSPNGSRRATAISPVPRCSTPSSRPSSSATT